MITVIVPVYNVEQYVEECIQSIINQTYTNLDILLINDGSTDSSREICHEWEKKDSRIRVIDKVNSGQAACRNLGVELAKGEYVTFVDSDDWIYPNMIERLKDAIEKNDADISICEADVELPGGKICEFSIQDMSNNCVLMRENPEIILTIRYTMWSKLYKRDFLLSNKIEQPNIKFEDFAIIPIILALAEKIAFVDESLYFYRYREGSTIRNLDYIEDRFKAIHILIDNFKRRDKFEEWKNILEKIVVERGVVLMRHIYPLLSKYYTDCYERYDSILIDNFGTSLSKINGYNSSYCRTGKLDANIFGKYNLAVIGSYNLMIVAKMMMKVGTPDFLENHYSFSNIMSIMSKPCDSVRSLKLSHKSDYRQKHIVQDFTKRLLYKNRSEFDDIDYVLLDFLEERFDVGCFENTYFTFSDVFREIEQQNLIEYSLINSTSTGLQKEWKEACIGFISLLKDYVGLKNVILVKNYLSEKILNEDGSLSYHENIEEIREINTSLKKKYEFFERNATEVIVWETENDEYYYTDKSFKHGCYPWHLNNKEYCKISGDLMSVLRTNFTYIDV